MLYALRFDPRPRSVRRIGITGAVDPVDVELGLLPDVGTVLKFVNKLLVLQYPEQATNEGCSATRAGVLVCDKCAELDGKIEHYRRLSSMMTDQQMIDGLKALIEKLRAEKAALHSEQKE